ncbi:16S rRNA (guanine(966)-N(2))-methyltransferase RsmD [Bacillus glycinifermentans]|uniref:16S rRNA (guanine(966)-N(2))-methyltransferase RsmD n=1 Tax=Bacillus glycinifermentans TaxID=1664069 RepID=UPI002DBD3387|nr:16S rRNA (guanine(966)-N(2))-methyltransferase RsmD [Bacillus glycinifermentans]MEC3606975.1 16S rRNA (guanine(966)-N(2))-methyltransferase RsmD [Bacillus glycinifermentans]
MRVISGTYKGRALKAVPGMSTRPTTDKVKESIFNMVGPYFDGGDGLDLYAGSGGLGIEALSRGFDRIVFVDRDFKAIQTVKNNLQTLGIQKRAEVYRNDADRALHALVKRGLTFDAIFLDPPYREQKLEALLSIVDKANMLTDKGFILTEHAKEVVLPEQVGELLRTRQEIYGVTGVTIYRKRGNGDG